MRRRLFLATALAVLVPAQALADDVLKLAIGQRGLWDSAIAEILRHSLLPCDAVRIIFFAPVKCQADDFGTLPAQLINALKNSLHIAFIGRFTVWVERIN